jgi:hypothetical protein
MKSFTRNALLGAAGLVLLSLPATAASSTAPDTSLSTPTTKQIQVAARNENPGGAGYRNENPGGAGFKKKGKKAKKKAM